MINRYDQKFLGAEPKAASLSTGLLYTSKKATERKKHKIIKKISSVVFNQVCLNNICIYVDR